VNHESYDPFMVFPDFPGVPFAADNPDPTREQVLIALASIGGSVIEVVREGPGEP
jgi:hypothetical protein